jgi:hypothetical protein
MFNSVRSVASSLVRSVPASRSFFANSGLAFAAANLGSSDRLYPVCDPPFQIRKALALEPTGRRRFMTNTLERRPELFSKLHLGKSVENDETNH